MKHILIVLTRMGEGGEMPSLSLATAEFRSALQCNTEDAHAHETIANYSTSVALRFCPNFGVQVETLMCGITDSACKPFLLKNLLVFLVGVLRLMPMVRVSS